MAIVWIILGVILMFLLSDYIWIILLVGGVALIIYYAVKAKVDEEAERQQRIRESKEAHRNDPTHTHYYKTTGSNAQSTSTPSKIANSSAGQTNALTHQPKLLKSNPTAQNAYILNLDFIRSSESSFIAFDVETTGLSPSSDRIIELSAVRFENFLPCKTFSTLINPQRHIPDSASKVNHIYDSDVANAPTESNAIKSFCDFIGKDALSGDITLVAHNAMFDIKFLLYALSRSGIDANIQFQDTLYMCRNADLGLPNCKLQTVAEHFGIIQEDAHRALDDARVCGKIFVKLLQAKKCQHLEKLSSLSPGEQDLCMWFKEIIKAADLNTQLLTFCSKTYLQAKCFGEVARFKMKAKKPYALITKETSIPEGIESVSPSKAEAEKYLRVYFSSPSDLAPLEQYYIEAYKNALNRAESYISDSTERMHSVAKQIDLDICI